MRNKAFSSNKKWGLIIAISVIFGLILILFIIDKNSENHNNAIIQDITHDWLQSQPTSQDNSTHSTQDYSENSQSNEYLNVGEYNTDVPYSPSTFDPNSASAETMLANGLPLSTVKRIIAYRNKGGTFYKKEKLLNFGIDENLLQKISPYLSLPQSKNNSNYQKNSYTNNNPDFKPKTEPTNLDINTATQEQFMDFKGIGPGYSKRIVEYRNKLGGFLSIEQLKEVYGLPPEVYDHIKDKIVINNTTVTKININTATLEQLSNHPYIRKYMAENIIKFRNDVKEFKSIQELRQIPLINDEKYRKIVPYITL